MEKRCIAAVWRHTFPPAENANLPNAEDIMIYRFPAFMKPTVYLLVVAFSICSIMAPAARAAMVPTGRTLAATEGEHTRSRLQTLLARADVQSQMEAWGVDPREALARVDSLSERELRALSARMDELPAGAGALETIAVVSLIAFLVLLFTDIMGYTNIFHFTR